MDDRAYTFEELSEMSRSSPRRSVDMMLGALQFTQLGQFDLSTFFHFSILHNQQLHLGNHYYPFQMLTRITT